MAKKIECDKCGKLVEHKKGGSEVSTISITYTKKQNATSGYNLPDYDWEEATKEIDLCSSCQVELLALFNKKDLRKIEVQE